MVVILTSSMAWTQQDADAVRAAVVDLAIGKRVAKVVYAGPPSREVDYVAADLPALRALLADMNRSLTTGPTYRLASTKKGL